MLRSPSSFCCRWDGRRFGVRNVARAAIAHARLARLRYPNPPGTPVTPSVGGAMMTPTRLAPRRASCRRDGMAQHSPTYIARRSAASSPPMRAGTGSRDRLIGIALVNTRRSVATKARISPASSFSTVPPAGLRHLGGDPSGALRLRWPACSRRHDQRWPTSGTSPGPDRQLLPPG